ncbi:MULTISPECIES: gamma carbonic anhydrase family protein [Streptomyces]|uniref:Gamma carbonic anhydrase family protein n=2 Tax=Streptomyces TaxID=1883 RepID=A0ABW6Z6A1_9ACTN|nr:MULTISPECIES: gamma carbonic anhydrase family protein [Streptomyces]MCL3992626.1 gamma carbonic anhydrase family protein [Streptomyces lavenduligriseus]QIS74152.1 gamma carbonic anhydrase family protein [Streptomyces sp. DSM 40868]WDM13281.1 gamma carbonic anhydrase family protein [Streptomyces lavenduligriseus]
MIHHYQGRVPDVSPTAYVAPSADLIGAVTVADQASIWFQAVLRADQNEIRIGARSNVQDGTVIHCDTSQWHGRPVVIGEDVTIGHKVHLHGCTIGDRCVVGSGSVVMDGADLPPYTFVAVGSVVRPNYSPKPGMLLVGNPARALRPLTDDERDYIERASDSYLDLAKNYSERTD